MLESGGVAVRLDTKRYELGDAIYEGILRYIIVEFDSKDLNAITLTPYLDNASQPDFTITPTGGFQRTKISIDNPVYKGLTAWFRFAFTQNVTNNNRPTKLYRAWVLYDLERRIF